MRVPPWVFRIFSFFRACFRVFSRGPILLLFRNSGPVKHRDSNTGQTTAAMAEWLRRWTRNPMGYSRVGSNPTRSEYLCHPSETVD